MRSSGRVHITASMVCMVSLGGNVSDVTTSPPIHHRSHPFLVGLFILDGVITIPIALLGFFIMPGMVTPSWSTCPHLPVDLSRSSIEYPSKCHPHQTPG